MATESSPQEVTSEITPIPGMLLFRLPVHTDNRGWFKENWQRKKMSLAGLPDFRPVQNNISFNSSKGTTRGIHAEPWDKFISVASGRVFGAWVDLRKGPSFGAVFTAELDASRAIYVPRGVGNAFQTLEDETTYTYLVNDHWSPEAQNHYVFLNLADESVHIPWPVELSASEISEKDRAHPRLEDVTPVEPKKILILGANGQLGKALRRSLHKNSAVEFAARSQLDIANPQDLERRDWSDYSAIINAAAYTAVDEAETCEGRSSAWQINVAGVAALSRVATEHRITLVHVSSDYVFDGTRANHTEEEHLSPLGVYGQTKAAGDAIVSTVPHHYIVRTSWVVGDGPNFVRTMVKLAEQGIRPSVVNDQIGRLTFTDDLAAAILHLLGTAAPFGTYNVTNSGDPISWADIAKNVYELCGRPRTDVIGISSAEYFAGSPSVARRPTNSSFDLSKVRSAGYIAPDMSERLKKYVEALQGH